MRLAYDWARVPQLANGLVIILELTLTCMETGAVLRLLLFCPGWRLCQGSDVRTCQRLRAILSRHPAPCPAYAHSLRLSQHRHPVQPIHVQAFGHGTNHCCLSGRMLPWGDPIGQGGSDVGCPVPRYDEVTGNSPRNPATSIAVSDLTLVERTHLHDAPVFYHRVHGGNNGSIGRWPTIVSKNFRFFEVFSVAALIYLALVLRYLCSSRYANTKAAVPG